MEKSILNIFKYILLLSIIALIFNVKQIYAIGMSHDTGLEEIKFTPSQSMGFVVANGSVSEDKLQTYLSCSKELNEDHPSHTSSCYSPKPLGPEGVCIDGGGHFTGGGIYAACLSEGTKPLPKGSGSSLSLIKTFEGAVETTGVDIDNITSPKINANGAAIALEIAKLCRDSANTDVDNWWKSMHGGNICVAKEHRGNWWGGIDQIRALANSLKTSGQSTTSSQTSSVSSDNPGVNVIPIKNQHTEYGGFDYAIVKRCGKSFTELQISSNSINTDKINQYAYANGEKNIQTIGLTDDERGIYHRLGPIYWDTQNVKWENFESFDFNVKDGMGRDIDYITFCDLSNNEIEVEPTADCYERLFNNSIYLLVPYDGVTKEITFEGKAYYYLDYVASAAYEGNLGQEAFSVESEECRKKITLCLDLREGATQFEHGGGLIFWDFNGTGIRVIKINKECKEIYGQGYYLPNVKFKLSNVFREDYSIYPNRSYVGFEDYGNFKDVFVCNRTYDEAFVFSTDENGSFEIPNAIPGIYRIIEVGNIHAGYESTWNLAQSYKGGGILTFTIEDSQKWVSVYGKVWEDIGTLQGKDYVRDNKMAISENGDHLLNNVIVRLKEDGVVLDDVKEFKLQETFYEKRYTSFAGGNYQEPMLEDMVIGYDGYDANKGVEIKYTILTGNQDYKFFDVRINEKDGKDILAEYRTGPGEFGFIGLDITKLLAGKYSIEFEYDGIIYKEVNAIEYYSPTNIVTNAEQSKNNAQNIEQWKNLSDYSKAYEYQSTKELNIMYPTRGRNEFNEEFGTVEGKRELNNPDSYSVKESIFSNSNNETINLKTKDIKSDIEEKNITYETQRLGDDYEPIELDEENESQVGYRDYSYMVNTLDDLTYGIVADTINYGLNLNTLFIYGETEYIEDINLGLYKRDQGSVNLSSDLVQVQVNMNGYKHLYWYADDKDNQNSEYNSIKTGEESKVGVKFHKSYSKGYKRTIYSSDIKYQDDDDKNNKLEVYATYAMKVQNTQVNGVNIGVEQITCWHNDSLDPISVGFSLNKATGVVNTDESISINSSDQVVNGSINKQNDDSYKFKRSDIKIKTGTNIIHCMGEEDIENTGKCYDVNNDNLELKNTGYLEIYVKYQLSEEKIKEISQKDGPYDEYLHQIFEISKYSLYKQKLESTIMVDKNQEETGKYYKFAGVLYGINPENADPRELKNTLTYYESDTSYSPIMKLEFNGERGFGGSVNEDQSVFKQYQNSTDLINSYKAGNGYTSKLAQIYNVSDDNSYRNSDGTYKLDKIINNYKTVFANDKLHSFNLRNGDGKLDDTNTDPGIGNIHILLVPMDSSYDYVDGNSYEETDSGNTNRVNIYYKTLSVPEDGTYGFNMKIAENTSDSSYNAENAQTFVTNGNITDDNFEMKLNSYLTNMDGTNADATYNTKNNITIIFEPVKVDSGNSNNFFQQLDMKKGEYYFPDIIPNQYKMVFTWGNNEERSLPDDVNNDVNISSYTSEQFKSSIVDKEFFNNDQNHDRTWFAKIVENGQVKTDNRVRDNDAADNKNLRAIIDNRIGQAQDNTNTSRNYMSYGDNLMSSVTRWFELKVESTENIESKYTNLTDVDDDNINNNEKYIYSAGEDYVVQFEEKQESDKKVVTYDIYPIDCLITLRPQMGIDVMKKPINVKFINSNNAVMADQDIGNDKDQQSDNENLVLNPLLNEINDDSGSIQLIIDTELRARSKLETIYEIEIINTSEVDFNDHDYYYFGIIPTQNVEDKIVRLKIQDVYEVTSNNYADLYALNKDNTKKKENDTDIDAKASSIGTKYWKLINRNSTDSTELTYESNTRVHEDDVKQSISKTIMKNKIYYLQSINISTGAKSEKQIEHDRFTDWVDEMVIYRQNINDDTYNKPYYQLDSKTFYISGESFVDLIQPGEITIEKVLARADITTSKGELEFYNFVDVGNVYSTTKSTTSTPTTTNGLVSSLKYYGSPIKLNSSNFKKASRPINIIAPTGANKNYSIYLITAITTLMFISCGLIILMMLSGKSKKEVVSIKAEQEDK